MQDYRSTQLPTDDPGWKRNRVKLNVTNNTHETLTFDMTEMIGVLDLRSLGYYKIKQGVCNRT